MAGPGLRGQESPGLGPDPARSLLPTQIFKITFQAVANLLQQNFATFIFGIVNVHLKCVISTNLFWKTTLVDYISTLNFLMMLIKKRMGLN